MTSNIKEKGGYDVEFVDIEPNDVTCSICLFVLREPMQAEQCGHRFCRSCVEDMKKSLKVPLTCPEDRREINLFQDKGKEREMSKFQVTCCNNKYGCIWTNELLYLEEHLKRCEHQMIKCCNTECEEFLSRVEMQIHVKKKCFYRKIRCQNCSKNYIFVQEEGHNEVCEKMPLDCQACNEKNIPRCEMSDHILNSCPKRLLNCKYINIGCVEKLPLEELAAHETSAVEVHLGCALNKLKAQDEQIKYQGKQIKKHEEMFVVLQSQLSNLAEIMNSSSADDLKKNSSNTFDWKFEGFSRKLDLAKKGDDPHVRRFIALSGYGCKVQVFLNGNSETKHKHISVVMSIEKGRFDGKLEWPMRATVSFSLVRNGCEKNTKLFMTTEPKIKEAFQSPGFDKSAGFPNYFPHNSLNGFVTNDTLTLRVKVQLIIGKSDVTSSMSQLC